MKYGARKAGATDCRKILQPNDYGKEDRVKETHQGCLSRSINQFFKL